MCAKSSYCRWCSWNDIEVRNGLFVSVCRDAPDEAQDPADLDSIVDEQVREMPAATVYARWYGWVERIARRLGVEVGRACVAEKSDARLVFSSSPSIQQYCERIGATFERDAQRGPIFKARADLQRQILLFWLGICIREGSVENFEECVLSSYRAVAFTNGNSQDENLSDEIRASLLSFTKEWAISEAPIKIWCAEAPLFGFLCETRLFRDPIIPNHLSSLEKPLLSASEISSSAKSDSMQTGGITDRISSTEQKQSKPVAFLDAVFKHFDDSSRLLEMVVSALVYAIDAGYVEATDALLKWCAPECTGGSPSGKSLQQKQVGQVGQVAQLAQAGQLAQVASLLRKSKSEVATSLNKYQLMTLMDHCFQGLGETRTGKGERIFTYYASCTFLERFMEGRIWMTPMLAATSRQARGSFGFGLSPKRSEQPKSWAAQVIRSLHTLGADLKSVVGQENEFLHVRVSQDPLYQLIKYEVLDVKQREIDEHRKPEVTVTAPKARGAIGNRRTHLAARRNARSDTKATGAANEEKEGTRYSVFVPVSDHCLAHEIILQNLEKWKVVLDEVLEPDSGKIRKDQVELAVGGLANSARVEVVPIISYLIDRTRFDINRPLPAADNANNPHHTQHIGDFYRSSYVCSMSLLKKGARVSFLPGLSEDGASIMRKIATDRQSTHLSQVHLVLKKHIELAEELVAKLSENPEKAAFCLATELARFCVNRSVAEARIEFAEALVVATLSGDQADSGQRAQRFLPDELYRPDGSTEEAEALANRPSEKERRLELKEKKAARKAKRAELMKLGRAAKDAEAAKAGREPTKPDELLSVEERAELLKLGRAAMDAAAVESPEEVTEEPQAAKGGVLAEVAGLSGRFRPSAAACDNFWRRVMGRFPRKCKLRGPFGVTSRDPVGTL
jgi:hypothetical protein